MNRFYKWILAILFLVIIGIAGFTFTVKEGTNALVSAFGKIRVVQTEAGLHFKWPWPFEKVLIYDVRGQYLDSGYTETLTNDKKNIIIQTYAIWNIEDALKFHTRIGDMDRANDYLNDLITNVKNGILGNYLFSALVSTNIEEIKIDDISASLQEQVAQKALENYGILVSNLKIKRLSLPYDNVRSVLEQMIADRQRFASQLIAEGERDAAFIVSEANAEAAKIIAEGKTQAAKIDTETEYAVASIYGEAYDRNSALFIFLKKLIALENSVNEKTTFILKADEVPFDILTE